MISGINRVLSTVIAGAMFVACSMAGCRPVSPGERKENLKIFYSGNMASALIPCG
jgi:hypothetical protein